MTKKPKVPEPTPETFVVPKVIFERTPTVTYRPRVRSEGGQDCVVATPVDRARIASQFTRGYLCSHCGQEGEIERFALAAGGTVKCPHCGNPMTTKGGA